MNKENTIETIKKLLGRNLTKAEEILYNLQKDKYEYYFEKDSKGNLISVKSDN